MGAGISGGGPQWAHEAGDPRGQGETTPRGWACPGPSWPGAGSPDVFSVPIILKYSGKNHSSFSGHLENFYFQGIFYCKANLENRQKILFSLYLI